MLCSILGPMLDVLQYGYNLFFFWAPNVGLSIPDARTLFGGFLGCTG